MNMKTDITCDLVIFLFITAKECLFLSPLRVAELPPTEGWGRGM